MRREFVPFLAPLLAVALAGSVAAQEVRDCDTWEANARNVMDPVDTSVRSFANGSIRIIGLDTEEPACCSAHLMVQYPEPNEPFWACRLVSDTGGMGFSGLLMPDLVARYDPATGLTVTVPAGRYDGLQGVMSPLYVTINQARGTVTATR